MIGKIISKIQNLIVSAIPARRQALRRGGNLKHEYG